MRARRVPRRFSAPSRRMKPNIGRMFVRGVGLSPSGDATASAIMQPNVRVLGVSTNQINSKMKKALIFGVSGQDGAYLAKLLLSKGYTGQGDGFLGGSKLSGS